MKTLLIGLLVLSRITTANADEIYQGKVTKVRMSKMDYNGNQIRLGSRCDLAIVNGRLLMQVEALATRVVQLIHLNNPNNLNELYGTASVALETCNDSRNCAKGFSKVRAVFDEGQIEKTSISVEYYEQKFLGHLIPLKQKRKADFECGGFSL